MAPKLPQRLLDTYVIILLSIDFQEGPARHCRMDALRDRNSGEWEWL